MKAGSKTRSVLCAMALVCTCMATGYCEGAAQKPPLPGGTLILSDSFSAAAPQIGSGMWSFLWNLFVRIENGELKLRNNDGLEKHTDALHLGISVRMRTDPAAAGPDLSAKLPPRITLRNYCLYFTGPANEKPNKGVIAYGNAAGAVVGEFPFALEKDTSYHIEMVVISNELTVAIDGVQVLKLTDPKAPEAGKVAIASYYVADPSTLYLYFDDAVIKDYGDILLITALDTDTERMEQVFAQLSHNSTAADINHAIAWMRDVEARIDAIQSNPVLAQWHAYLKNKADECKRRLIFMNASIDNARRELAVVGSLYGAAGESLLLTVEGPQGYRAEFRVTADETGTFSGAYQMPLDVAAGSYTVRLPYGDDRELAATAVYIPPKTGTGILTFSVNGTPAQISAGTITAELAASASLTDNVITYTLSENAYLLLGETRAQSGITRVDCAAPLLLTVYAEDPQIQPAAYTLRVTKRASQPRVSGGGGGSPATVRLPAPAAEPSPSPAPLASPAPEIGFFDVTEADWFYSDVVWAVAEGMFKGVSVTVFAPEERMTYSMAEIVVHRVTGKTEPAFYDSGWITRGQMIRMLHANGEDTDEAAAVEWAVSAGILRGYADGDLRLEDDLTRSQACALLRRMMRK